MGAWNSGVTYAQYDQVTYSGTVYGSLQNSNLNHQPDTSPTWWIATPLWASKLGGGAVLTPQLQASKVVGGAVLTPQLQASRLTGYAVATPQLQASKVVAYAVLFPAAVQRPFLFRSTP